MGLPRFHFPDEDEDDSTAPAEFVLKLPASYAQKLESLRPPMPTWTPSVPWTIEPPPPAAPPRTKLLLAVLASIAVAVLVAAGIGSAVAQAGDGPVGVSRRAPKSLDRFVRASARHSGVAPRLPAVSVSIESLQRPHARRRR